MKTKTIINKFFELKNGQGISINLNLFLINLKDIPYFRFKTKKSITPTKKTISSWNNISLIENKDNDMFNYEMTIKNSVDLNFIPFFIEFFLDNLSSLIKDEKYEEINIKLENFYELFKKRQLEDNEIKGIFGELYFIKYGLDNNLISITDWQAGQSYETNHDFIQDNKNIEIKTTEYIKNTLQDIHFSNMHQLTTNKENLDLFIVKVEKSDDDNDLSIKELIEYIKLDLELKNKTDELNFFSKKVKKYIFVNEKYKVNEFYKYIIKKKGIDKFYSKDELITINSDKLKGSLGFVVNESFLLENCKKKSLKKGKIL